MASELVGSAPGEGPGLAPAVLLGRWQDVLPGAYDPASTVVVTDPPYGLGELDVRGYDDVIPWADHVAEVLRLLPAARHVIRGPATAIVRRDYPAPRRLGIETATYRRRGAHRPGVVPYLWQAWAIYGALRIGRRRRRPSGDVVPVRPYADPSHARRPRPDGPLIRHGGATPYASALWAVETWTEPGWLVLDPFAGLGTIGVAATSLGLDYLGAEVDPTWHTTAQLALLTTAPTFGLG